MTPKVVRRRPKVKEAPLSAFATTSAGLEVVLEKELRGMGFDGVERAVRGVSFKTDLEGLYKANLWLRTASRVLVKICEFDAKDRKELYDGVRSVDWSAHMDLDLTLAVDAVSSRSEMDHTQFASRVVKDGIVDQFTEKLNARPSVDPKTPDIPLNLRIKDNHCTLSWDSSGPRLHRRGYRPSFGGPAPLQEILAAGMVLLSGYTGEGQVFDPMCGSGTILIEAALIAKNAAPGLSRKSFAFMKHPTFSGRIWSNVRGDAQTAVQEVDGCPISGADISPDAVRAAQAAARGAGVDDMIRIKTAALSTFEGNDEGHLITNPPYGERLGELNHLSVVYTGLGDLMKTRCRGMSAHILTGSKYLSKKIGLKTKRRDALWNGPLECRLLHYEIY